MKPPRSHLETEDESSEWKRVKGVWAFEEIGRKDTNGRASA